MTSISAVLVLGERPVDIETLNSLSAALAAVATNSEIIMVANDVSMEQVQRLRSVVNTVPDLTCVLLAKPVDVDIARMVGNGSRGVRFHPACRPPLTRKIRLDRAADGSSS